MYVITDTTDKLYIGTTFETLPKPGEIVWSRVFMADGKLKMDQIQGLF